MPGADADSNLQQAGNLQTALVRATPEIILSHARNEEDRPLLASPLLANPESSAGTGAPARGSHMSKPAHNNAAGPESQVENYAQVVFADRKIESITDTAAPPVTGLQ